MKRHLIVLTVLMACFAVPTRVATAQEKGLVFAHRGGAHEFEENTMKAFQQSYEAGLRGLKLMCA